MQYPPTMTTRPSQRRLLSTPKTVLPRNIRLRFSAGFFCLGTLNNIVSPSFRLYGRRQMLQRGALAPRL